MDLVEARELMERIRIITHACDLDLLLFFADHPTTLVMGDGIAPLLGYDSSQIARSMGVLLGAGLIQRSQEQAGDARMYRCTLDGNDDLHALVRAGRTRQGRLLLRQALPPGAAGKGGPT